MSHYSSRPLSYFLSDKKSDRPLSLPLAFSSPACKIWFPTLAGLRKACHVWEVGDHYSILSTIVITKTVKEENSVQS